MGKIHNFEGFLRENYSLNEGLRSWISSFFKKAFSKAKGWYEKFLEDLEQKKISLIPSGPKAGTPVAMVFSPAAGSISAQIEAMYGKKPILKESQMNEVHYPQQWQRVPGIKGNVEDVSPQWVQDYLQTYYNKEWKMKDLSRKKGRKGETSYLPLFIFGSPGVGKTGVIGKFCDDNDLMMVNLDIQFMSAEDFLGLPVNVEEEPPQYKVITDEDGKERKVRISTGKRFTAQSPPSWFPTDLGEKGKGGVIFMDEFNRAQSQAVLNATMQFVQQGRIGNEYELPGGWIIVAAGNRPGEAEVLDPDPALASRFQIVNMVTTAKDYREYAKGNRAIIPELIYFLEQSSEDLLHYLDPDEDPTTFPCPRSWTQACEMLAVKMDDLGVQSWRDVPMEKIDEIFRGRVGANAAGQFVEYLNVIKEIEDSDLDKMATDPARTPMINTKGKKQLLHATMDMALGRIKQYDPKKLANILEYFDRYNQKEMIVWLYRRIIQEYPEFGVALDKDPDKLRGSKIAMEANKSKLK